mgnify:CR=1 FL=1
MKVDPVIEETLIPMFAGDHEALQEQRKKRNQYWSMLRRARADFIKLTEQASVEYDLGEDAFYYYLKQNFGLQVELIDGNIAGEGRVVDEKKYLLFLLKYGQ